MPSNSLALQELAAATNAREALAAARTHEALARRTHAAPLRRRRATSNSLGAAADDAPQQQRRAPVRHILDNSQDDPIARFERENDGGKRRPHRRGLKRARRSSQLARAAVRSRSPASRAGAKVFEKLVDYPCEFTIKVIGFDDETFCGRHVPLHRRRRGQACR